MLDMFSGMEEVFNNFITGFCKVQFLCYEGTPNWLGWGILGIASLVLIIIIFAWAGS
jgi:hypothetical protein